MKRLTVIQLLPELNGGGVERGTLEIAKGLVNAGHRSIVISHGGRLVSELEREGSEHITLPVHKKSLWSLWQVPRLRKIFDDLRPDIIHARSRLPAWLAYLAWKGQHFKRSRFITTVHGLYSVNAYSKIMVKGEAIIAVSETVENYIKANYPDVDLNKIIRIYRGISPQSFPYGFKPSDDWMSQWRAQYPQLTNQTILCLPGRLTRLKGHLDFLDLVARLHAQGRKVFGLVVGGEDPRRLSYADEVRAKVIELGLSEHILFAGHRTDIKEIYALSDIVYSLSNKPESFGRTVLEPLAMGRPVIAYSHGGVAEILRSLFPEGAVELKNVQQLVDKTQQLLDSANKPSANNPFLLEHMVQATLTVYRELADRASKT